jgi:carbonic anhydrase/acetyltransferase-like protein (isoleucine patch superfamily)
MSGGPANASASAVGEPKIADSAVVLGTARLGEGSLLAEGAVVRSFGAGVEIGTGSAVLENSVVVAGMGMGSRRHARPGRERTRPMTTVRHVALAVGSTC